MAWNYDLKIDGYDFMFMNFDGFVTVNIPSDADLNDKAYLKALKFALKCCPVVADLVEIKEIYRRWYGDYDSQKCVHVEEALIVLNRYMKQTLMTKGNYIYQLADDIINREPMFTKPSAKSKQRDESGYVYLLKSENGHYKIGKAKNPENRLKTFTVKLPFHVEYVCTIETIDMRELEQALHEQFASKRIDGEWFNLEPKDIEYIKGMAS